MAGRRGHGEDGVSFDHRGPCTDPERHRHCPGRWVGQAELPRSPDGKRNRRRVVGKTKTAVLDKLKELHKDLDRGIVPQTGFSGYTVREAAEDFLKTGLDGRSAKTIKKNENVLEPILVVIGAKRLRELTASDVQQALATMATRYSTAAVIMGHNALTRTIRHAEARDRVGRNVATLVDTPKGQAGRPSKSLTLAQAEALMAASKDSRLHAYIALCLSTGIRTEEARELRWDHLDLNGHPDADPPIPPSAAVWRSVRAHGDVKTEKSRRTLMLSKLAVTALQDHQQTQNEEKREAGGRWQDSGLVFTTRLRDRARCGQRPEGVQGGLQAGRNWRGLDTSGATALVRLADVGLRGTRRGDRPHCRTLQLPHHRGCLPKGAAAGPYRWGRTHGQDLGRVADNLATRPDAWRDGCRAPPCRPTASARRAVAALPWPTARSTWPARIPPRCRARQHPRIPGPRGWWHHQAARAGRSADHAGPERSHDRQPPVRDALADRCERPRPGEQARPTAGNNDVSKCRTPRRIVRTRHGDRPSSMVGR